AKTGEMHSPATNTSRINTTEHCFILASRLNLNVRCPVSIDASNSRQLGETRNGQSESRSSEPCTAGAYGSGSPAPASRNARNRNTQPSHDPQALSSRL